MLNSNEKPRNGVAMIGPVPLVPAVILIIWLVMWAIYYFHGLSREVSKPIVLATCAWFIIWLVRAVRRG